MNNTDCMDMYRQVLATVLSDLTILHKYKGELTDIQAGRKGAAQYEYNQSVNLFFNRSGEWRRHLEFLCDSADIFIDRVYAAADMLRGVNRYIEPAVIYYPILFEEPPKDVIRKVQSQRAVNYLNLVEGDANEQ